MEKAELRANGINSLLKVLSKPDALRLFNHALKGIKNSTYAIEELNLTPKKYYARLRDLIDVGLVRKRNSCYGQTALGRMIYERFLPAMGKAVEAKEELEFLVGLEGLDMDNGVKKRILEELKIPVFADSNVKLLRDYEALVIEAIDLSDSAEKSVLFASNYLDVRVMEATFRVVDRGVTNRLIIGKKSLSSKLKNLRMMLSVTFAKTIINFASNKVDLEQFVRISELPYTFIVVDGQHSIIEISKPLNERFVVAISIDDRSVAKKFTDSHNELWEAGEFDSVLKRLNLLNPN